MKKKMVTVLLTAAMVTAMAAGCGKSSDSGSDKKESYTIGIEQFAEHGSLDNCREGFLKGLEDEGSVPPERRGRAEAASFRAGSEKKRRRAE